MSGKFTVVGIGPGDPELITIKAARIIAAADVVAYHAGVRKQSHARRIAADLIPASALEEQLRYPVTTGHHRPPGRLRRGDGRLLRGPAPSDWPRTSTPAATWCCSPRATRCSTARRCTSTTASAIVYDTEVVPGVPAFAAATAAISTPLVRQTDVLTVLPGTLPEPELARRLAGTDAAIIMKLGRTFPAVRSALEQAGRLDGACTSSGPPSRRSGGCPSPTSTRSPCPYFSLIVVPGDTAHRPSRARLRQGLDESAQPLAAPTAELLVVGLGPGPDCWLTPEVSAALASVDHVVGYGPYVDRVPQRAGLTRHASGNTVEVDRARVRARPRAVGREGRGRVRRRRRGLRDGVRGLRGGRGFGVRRRVDPRPAGSQRRAGRGRPGRRPDRRRLRGGVALGPAEAVGGRRATAAGDRRGRPGAGDLQPGLRGRGRRRSATAQDVLLEHRKPDTVVVVGRDIGRAEESLTVTTLAELDPATIDMKCLLIVGASGTRVSPAGVWTPRYVRVTVHFVGAGPGAADLLTVRATRLLAAARRGALSRAPTSTPRCSRTVGPSRDARRHPGPRPRRRSSAHLVDAHRGRPRRRPARVRRPVPLLRAVRADPPPRCCRGAVGRDPGRPGVCGRCRSASAAS